MFIGLVCQLMFAVTCVIMGIATAGYLFIYKGKVRWLALCVVVLGIIPILVHCIFVKVVLTMIATAIYIAISTIVFLILRKKTLKTKIDDL